MSVEEMDIGQLADQAGISRRAVRFYVQRGLLPAPNGLGRGRHYDQRHLDALEQIRRMQASGYSLDAIGRVLKGEPAEAVAPNPATRPAKPPFSAELWTRVRLAEGVELHFDATTRNVTVEEILAIQQILRKASDNQQ